MSERPENDANFPRVLAVLDLLTEEELVQLNHIVIHRLRLMQQIHAHGAMMNLRERVRFTSSLGEVIRGVITRHNCRSVTIVTDGGGQWRVAPDLLQAE